MRQLLDSGHAYEDEGAVRFRVPDEGEITFQDAVLGDVTNPYSAIKDFVVQRSDGSPLYNLAVAVDDRDMGITHVVRGQDHVSNTPRQLMLLQALGAEPPMCASRCFTGPTEEALEAPRRRVDPGRPRRLPAGGGAQLHRAARVGHDESTTFMTTDELVERFALERVSKSPAVFDEQKLRWMNGRYMRELSPDELQRRLERFYDRELPREIVEISQEKMQTLKDFEDLAGLLDAPPEYDDKAWERWGRSPHLRAVRDELAGIDTWDTLVIEPTLKRLVDHLGVKPKEIYQPIRKELTLTGKTVSPGIFESLWALGRESLSRSKKRLQGESEAA